MNKTLLLLLIMLSNTLIYSQNKVKDIIVIDLIPNVENPYRLTKDGNIWLLDIKNNPEDYTYKYSYTFNEMVEVEQPETKHILTPICFDRFILDLYNAKEKKNKDLNIGRAFATTLIFSNLFIKTKIGDEIKYHRVFFKSTFREY